MKNAMVSIVVTCYNYGRYLDGCLRSALAQTYGNLEILAINDGSTDDTEAVVRPFLSDPRVKYIRQPNSGHAVSKNNGVANASGEFVAFLDADDLWTPDKLAKQMPLFVDRQVGVVYSRMQPIDDQGAHAHRTMEDERVYPRRGQVTEPLFYNNFVPFSSSVVRRECFEKLGNFDHEYVVIDVDWDLWLRFSIEYKFDYVDEPLMLYRIGHPGQMSKSVEPRMACADRIIAKFLRAHPQALPERVIRDAMAYSYTERAYYFRSVDLDRSNRYYMRSIGEKPFQTAAYRGLIKNAWLGLFTR